MSESVIKKLSSVNGENLKKPLEIAYVFDNEGQTLNRYTIVVLFKNGESYIVYSCENPTRVNGSWSHIIGYTSPERTDDKQIEWSDLPLVVKQSLLGYFFGWTYQD